MSTDVTGTLDEAYERLHATGPEFDGWLSNHGPMAAEAMVRHGHAGRVHRWLDGYMRRLEEFPRGSTPIGEDWREAVKAYCDAQQFWPNVWFVSDHGNAHLVDMLDALAEADERSGVDQ